MIKAGTIIRLQNLNIEYIVIGVVQLNSPDYEVVVSYPYYGKNMLNEPIIQEKILLRIYDDFCIIEEVGFLEGVKEWYLKNCMLYSLMNMSSFVLSDKKLRENNPIVGRQYMGIYTETYYIYLGSRWFLKLGKEPITKKDLKSLSDFNFVLYSSVAKYYVKDFQIKLADYPVLLAAFTIKVEQQERMLY